MSRLRRAASVVAVLATATALLAGCVAPTGSSDTDETLDVGVIAGTLASIHPGKFPRTGSQAIIWSVYSRLTQHDGDGNIIGDLATDWRRTSDTEWEFDIRTDAVFENGVPLDTDVILWNFEQHRDPDTDWTIAADWIDRVTDVSAVDEDTVRIVTDEPLLELPNYLTQIAFLEPGWAAEHNPDVEALGSGAYKLISYEAENSAALEASDTFWGDTPDYADVNIIAYSQASSRLAALKSRDIDLTITIAPTDLEDLTSDTQLIVGGSGGQRTHTLEFNFLRPELQDVRVRQALNYAIDRESIIENIYLGTTESNGQTFSQHYRGYEPDYPTWEYDLDAAKELIASTPYAAGFDLNLIIPAEAYAGAELAAQAIADSWKQIGVNLEIEVLPTAVNWERYASEDNPPDLAYWGLQSIEISQTLKSWRSDRRTNVGELENHAEFDQIIQELYTSATEEEFDEHVHEGSRWLTDNAALIFLWDQPQTYAYDSSIDWEPRYDDWIDLVNIKRAD